jgi:hypothetical protein
MPGMMMPGYGMGMGMNDCNGFGGAFGGGPMTGYGYGMQPYNNLFSGYEGGTGAVIMPPADLHTKKVAIGGPTPPAGAVENQGWNK